MYKFNLIPLIVVLIVSCSQGPSNSLDSKYDSEISNIDLINSNSLAIKKLFKEIKEKHEDVNQITFIETESTKRHFIQIRKSDKVETAKLEVSLNDKKKVYENILVEELNFNTCNGQEVKVGEIKDDNEEYLLNVDLCIQDLEENYSVSTEIYSNNDNDFYYASYEDASITLNNNYYSTEWINNTTRWEYDAGCLSGQQPSPNGEITVYCHGNPIAIGSNNVMLRYLRVNFLEEDYPPSIPELVSPIDNTVAESPVNFIWELSDGNPSPYYQIRVWDDSTFDEIFNTNSETNQSINLQGDKIYNWSVRAYNGVGTSQWSETRSVGVLPDPPGVPTLLQKDYEYHSSYDAYTPKMTWNPVPDADYYEIEVTINYDMDNPPFPSPSIITPNGTEYISPPILGIWVDTYHQGYDDYIYKVRAVKNTNIGAGPVKSNFSNIIHYARYPN